MLSPYLEAVLLGITQGITEFLPISSTGHLIILQRLFGLSQTTYGLSFDLFTSIGTTAAIITYFRKDLAGLLKAVRFPQSGRRLQKKERQVWWVIGVTVLVGLAGLLLEDTVATTFRSPTIVAYGLIGFSFFMVLAEWLASRRPTSAQLTAGRAYGIGLAQILAFIPGISRSGATITTGLLLGMNREAAARFTFLLSVPIFLLAILRRAMVAVEYFATNGLTLEVALVYLIGLVTAGLVGYYTIHFLLRYLAKHSLTAFAVYRVLLGLAVLWFIA